MKDKNILWIHDKSLRINFDMINDFDEAIHIWDNEYYKTCSFSLKRLVFIYETLCEIQVEIIYGNIIEIFKLINPKKIIIPFTTNLEINKIIFELNKLFKLEIIKEDYFVNLDRNYQYKRFFNYWNKAKKTAFLFNGKAKCQKE